MHTLQYRQVSSAHIASCSLSASEERTQNAGQIRKAVAKCMRQPWYQIELVSLDDCILYQDDDDIDIRKKVEVMVHPVERNVPGDKKTDLPDITDPSITEERVAMSCGHAMTPDNLYHCACVALKDGTKTIQCFKCRRAWEFSEVAEKSCMSTDERIFWGSKLTLNTLRMDDSLDIAECPKCRSFCQRENPEVKNIRCNVCLTKGNTFDFCWICKEEWKSGHDCEQKSKEDIQKLLETCPKKTMAYSNIPDVPSVRLCPNCGALIEHSEACKETQCKRCKQSFCFVCLTPCKGTRLQCSNYSSPCTVAPIQKLHEEDNTSQENSQNLRKIP